MKLFKFGGWNQMGQPYYIVSAETKEEAMEKVNDHLQKEKDKHPLLDIQLYALEDCTEHDSDVWEGEWA